MKVKAPSKKPPRKPPKTLAPQTEPNDPDKAGGGTAIYLPRLTAGVRVTEDTALTQSAVWACVRCISESLAALPLDVQKKRADGGQDTLDENVVDWLLSKQANPETPAFYFREAMVAWALTWGNGYAEIERDLAGRPVWLWQITPDRVNPERVDLDTVIREGLGPEGIGPGDLVYKVDNYGDNPTYLPAQDMIHLRGLGFDGLVGYPVIRMASRSIGAAIASDTAASDYFNNDSTPGGILKHPGRLSDPARDNLRKTWQERHGGPSKRRTVAILEEGLEWSQTGLPPEASQLIETRQFSPAEIARWFRVPPHMIGDLSRATFSNIESQQIQFVTDCLMPWARRFEQELNIKLFGRINRGQVYAEHDFKGRLRGDTKAQTEHLQMMLDRGVYDINDALAYLGLNPIGPDGNKRFVQANMVLLEKAGEEPTTPSPGAPPSQPDNNPADNQDTPDGQDTQDQQMKAWRHVFLDACGRVARRGSDEKARAKPDFIEKQVRFYSETVLAVAEGYAELFSRNAQQTAAVAVQVASMAMKAGLEAGDPLAWSFDPESMAHDLIRGIKAAASAE